MFKIKNIYKTACLTLLFVFITSCTNNVNKVSAFLDKKEAEYEDISIQMGEAYWNYYSDEAVADLETPKLLYVELYSNDTLNQIIEEWYPKRNSLKNKVLKRRIEIWNNILTAAKINYNEDNLKLQNKIEYWLGEDDSVEGKPSNDELNALVIELMKNRNEQAKALGFKNYADLMLSITETGYDWLIDFADTIEKRTAAPFQKLKSEYLEQTGKEFFTAQDGQGLAIQYYINQITPQVMGDTMRAVMKNIINQIGIDYNKLPFRAVENQMPPGVGGQGIAVQVPHDFRIALNPNLDLDTWMHELGHGLHAMFTSVESPILKGYEWSFGSGNGGFSEGMAETSARFVRNPINAKQFSDQSDDDIALKMENAKKYLPAYLRFWLSLFMFEVEYYNDMDQDPLELQYKLIEKYRDTDISPSNGASLANVIFVSYPLYSQNYVVADVVSWQIHETLKEKFGEDYVINPEVGQFLIDNFYKDGITTHWQDRLIKVTGSKLDLNGFLSYYGL